MNILKLVVLTTIVTMSLVTHAHAGWGDPAVSHSWDDTKVFPATMCETYRYGVTSSPDSLYRGGDGAVYNKTSGSVYALCPIPIDTTSSKPKIVEIRLRDNHSSQNIRCTALGRNVDGSYYNQVTKSTSGYSSSLKKLTLYVDVPTKGSLVVSCKLPPKQTTNGPSSIVSIALGEFS